MFGVKYSRLKFWIISIILLFISIPILIAKDTFKSPENVNIISIIAVSGLLVSVIWINTLANRIRDYGDNPWISLFSIIPFANIGLALFYGIAKSNIKEVAKKNDGNSLSSAVYNHSKEIINGIKPAINEYKEIHTSSDNNSQNNNINIDESKIYEDVMLEIEQDNKVKSTWAKALAQGDGNKDKAESLYINFRVEELKKELVGDFESNHLNSDIEERVEIKRDSSSKKIVFLIILISVLVTICIPIFTIIYFDLNKDTSTTISSSIQSDNTSIQNSTNIQKDDVISNNANSITNKTVTSDVKNKWKYKDWEIENIDDNFIKAFTIGKNRADVFTIIKKKRDCNQSFLYTTTHLFDKSIQVNKNDILKMDIKVNNELFNSDTAIYEIFNLGFVKQLMSTPYPLYESFIEKLKNGNTIQTTVFSPILKDIDITPNEEYSLNGFTKTYNVLNEACRDINTLNRYKEVDKNTINQYVSTNNDKMSLIESIECDGKKVKLISNDEYYMNEGLLLLDNGKSIRLQDMNIDGDIQSKLKCKKVNGKSHLIITSTAGNSWSGHYSINLDTLKANLIDNSTEIKLGLKEEYVIEKTKMVINNIVYEVPKHPYDFAQNNEIINFKDLLGSNYETFLWNLQVGSNIEDVGQYYVGSGNGKSSGGMYEAIFTIDKFTGNTSVAILTTDFNKNHTKNIKYFGDITYPIDKWVKNLQKTE